MNHVYHTLDGFVANPQREEQVDNNGIATRASGRTRVRQVRSVVVRKRGALDPRGRRLRREPRHSIAVPVRISP